MDNQGFAGGPGGTDVGAKTLALPFQVALQPVVVKAGFADCDDPGVLRQAHQFVHARFRRVFIIRVDADRCIDLWIFLRQVKYLWKVGKINRNA